MSLNELFVQILQSEQRARERKNLLNDIKSKISATSHLLHTTQAKVVALRSDVSARTEELSAEELECRWVHNKESILTEQLADLTGQKQALVKQMENLQTLQSKELEMFSANVSRFVEDYGLASKGHELRLCAVREKVAVLKTRQAELMAELEVSRKQKDMLTSIDQEKLAMEKENERLKQEIKDAESRLSKEKAKTAQLEAEKLHVAEKPHSDPEFKRLHAELEGCRDDSLEGLCQALQQQIDQLQRQQWQQQLHRQHSGAAAVKQEVIPPVSTHQPTWTSSQGIAPYQQQSQQHGQIRQNPGMREEDGAKKTNKRPGSSRPNLKKLKSALRCQADEE
ncbi:coiled-coil domain-containing protein 172-like [Diadema antillarum]|uniref:coiled-coil domain-containing protein 172-like n=1 Tax=Diadema antillarum TaxID=105358 RepID=UPI003A841539